MIREAAQTMSEDARCTAPKYVVTLVHGTVLFRRKGTPSWIEDGSFFRGELRKTLNGMVEFFPFRWSGDNSHRERAKAVRQLEAQLIEQHRSNPHAKHFVIAHSHGGNVARWAVQNAECAKSISGIVCLATPFIRLRPRNIEPTLRRFPLVLWGLAAFLAFLALQWSLVIIDVIRLATPKSPPTSRALALLSVVVFAAWQAVTWLLYLLQSRWWRPALAAVRQSQTRERANTDPDLGDNTPLFCAIPWVDEPSVWLSFVRRLAAVPFWLWSPNRWLFYVATVCFLPLLFIPPDLPPLFAIMFATSFMGGMYAFGFVVHLVLMVGSKVVRSHRFGFGSEEIRYHLLFDVYTDGTPESTRATTRSYAVLHCSIYENPQVIRDVADWLSSTANPSSCG
jgi:hypothetical protein